MLLMYKGINRLIRKILNLFSQLSFNFYSDSKTFQEFLETTKYVFFLCGVYNYNKILKKKKIIN